MNKERLLNVAKACRETKFPDAFTMEKFGHNCNTPACALGNYAIRDDLQSTFSLRRSGELRPRDEDRFIGFDDDEVLDHFGLTYEQSNELFSPYGCAEAQTPNEAAEFIERFVAENS